jgi:hypothetical protein
MKQALTKQTNASFSNLIFNYLQMDNELQFNSIFAICLRQYLT